MTCFYYWIPNTDVPGKVTREFLDEQGLGCVFDKEGFSIQGNSSGPDGTRGVVVAYADSINYGNKNLVWQKIHGIDAWIGYDKTDPPTPADLARESGVDGFFVELGDGNQWVAPRARLAPAEYGATGSPAVPCSHAFKNGEWTRGGPLRKHQKLWAAACEFWDVVEPELDKFLEIDRETITLGFAREHILATTALAANYRIQRTEASILGLFDDETVGEILRTLIDWPSIVALLVKKKAADLDAQENSSTDPGKPGGTIPTGQQ